MLGRSSGIELLDVMFSCKAPFLSLIHNDKALGTHHFIVRRKLMRNVVINISFTAVPS